MRFEYFILFLKGLAMGTADVVPGVSGGTIAFITGIYERLIYSLSAFKPSLFVLWRKEGFFAVWRKIDGGFLLALLLGIACAIFTLAGVVSYLIENYPLFLWSFFFGLVLFSVFFLLRSLRVKNTKVYAMMLLGALLALSLVFLPERASSEVGLWYVFFSAMLAICAMILPGISGSFVLVLLGSYETVIQAVHQFDFVVIFVFVLGAVIGLLAFAQLLRFLLTHFYDATIALLLGFVAGSLFKIWPWRFVPEGASWQVAIFYPLCFIMLGFFLVLILEAWSAWLKRRI